MGGGGGGGRNRRMEDEMSTPSGVSCPQVLRQQEARAHLTALLQVDWVCKPFNSYWQVR